MVATNAETQRGERPEVTFGGKDLFRRKKGRGEKGKREKKGRKRRKRNVKTVASNQKCRVLNRVLPGMRSPSP